MMQGLSANAHKILTKLSQNIAREFKAEFLQPEHALLAIIRHRIGRGFRVLENLHVDILSLQVLLEQQPVFKIDFPAATDIPLSRRLQALLETAGTEARALRHGYIGSEHLLLALARDEQGILAKFFLQEGIFLDDARRIAVSLYGDTTRSDQGGPNKQSQSAIEEFGEDITEKSRKELFDRVVGRDKEIERVIQILSRRTKNNPVLIGEPGVGKTSIIIGLAERIVNESVPRNLLSAKIILLDLGTIIAGTKYRGQFEERLKKIIKEASDDPDIILFIDELHTLIGTGGSQGSMDAAHLLKPVLASGAVRCIGATTFAEYRKYFEKDGALERRFQTVVINEPSEKDTQKILYGLKEYYELRHNVEYKDGSIKKIVEFSKRYMPERFFPDKAIDVLDEAGAMKRVELDRRPAEILTLEQRIAFLTNKKETLSNMQNYEDAALVRDESRELSTKLSQIKQQWRSPSSELHGIIQPNDIARAVSIMTDIPISAMSENEADRLLTMETEIARKLIGQDEAIHVVANALRRSRAGISSPERPIGSFLWIGPTGVGKTLLAKLLAEFLFGSIDSLIRIDMSDYMEKHNAARLVGAPPGYVGFENGGTLTEKIRHNPYSVILLDEIEKAHRDVFNLLLQILEEGELKDNLGHTVNFRNTVIIMTGNIGSRSIIEENKLGFSTADRGVMDYKEIKTNTLSEVKKVFSPEFINRIDETVVFAPLNNDSLKKVLTIELAKLHKRLDKKDITLTLDNKAEEYCVAHGYDPAYGARPMRRLIQTQIEDPLALKIMSGELTAGDTVTFSANPEGLIITVQAQPLAPHFTPSEDTQISLTYEAAEKKETP